MSYLYKSIYLTLKMLKYIKLANLKIDMNSKKEETKKLITEFTHVFWATSPGPLLNLDPFLLMMQALFAFVTSRFLIP